MMNNIKKSRKYAIIVQETNFLMKGYLGWLIRNNKTIPLSLDHKYLSENFLPTLETLLNRGYYILIYPEQEMWYNYRKPRNPMPGAYRLDHARSGRCHPYAKAPVLWKTDICPNRS